MRSSIDEASIAHWRALAGKFASLDHTDRRCDATLAELIQRCLARDPAKRPTAVEVVAMCGRGFDWTDDAAAERAAVIADPIGYQRRVAPARVAGLIRAAREALAGRDLFGALRLCDRGLAYAADDAELLAIVATAGEAKTDTAMAIAVDAMAITATAPATATASATGPVTSRTWPWIALALAGLGVGVTLAYVLTPERTPRLVEPSPVVINSTGSDRDKQLAQDFIGFLGDAVAHRNDDPAPTNGPAPTTARGWLALANKQAPAQAAASIRHALALAPGWPEAQAALCVTLAAAHDPGALPPCEVAVTARPGDTVAHAARGAARVQVGHFADALDDLDRVVAADPDPKWRRLRAKARDGAGDVAGAQRDRADACQLGDAAACHE